LPDLPSLWEPRRSARMSEQILHVIVAGTRPEGGIRFRRNRLAEYLLAQPATAGVLWLYSRTLRAAWRNGNGTVRQRSGFEPVAVPDLRRLAAVGGVAQGLVLRPLVRRVAANPAQLRVLWFTKPIYAKLLDAGCWDAAVYDCSDFWTGSAPGRHPIARFNSNRLERAESAVIRGSDRIFATSAFLVDRIRERFGHDADLVENGVDFDMFACAPAEPPAEIAELPRPMLGFVGAMKSHKIDFALLHRVAAAHRGGSVVLIGPDEAATDRSGDFSRLCSQPNVHWLGPRAGSEIPRYLKALDLGLLPYRDAEYNRGVFPIKFFEYLAAGLPVVGCGLPSTVRYSEEGVYRHVGAEAEEFSAACEAAIGWHDSADRRREVAAAADWNTKFRLMLDAALECVETRRPVARR
jgi:teichuronic acid biosynthesis glycosyltransferase TuaH